MALYTKSYLRRIAATETMNESTRLYSQRDLRHDTFDIFLSHRFLDREEVRGMYLELTRKGLSVYVDWIVDPHLDRTNVTKDTAETVRKRLHASRSLLLAFSTNSSLSKWMPWELGYVDGHTQRCAIAPVSEVNQDSFDRTEYLLLYPMLLKEGSYPQESGPGYITEARSTYVDLSGWLRGSKPTMQNRSIF